MKLSDGEHKVIYREDDELFNDVISHINEEGFSFFLVGGYTEDLNEKTKRKRMEIMHWIEDAYLGEFEAYLQVPFTLEDLTYSVFEDNWRGKKLDGKYVLDINCKPILEKYRLDLLEQIAFIDEAIVYDE